MQGSNLCHALENEGLQSLWTQIGTLATGDASEVREILAVWPQLPPPLRAAVLAIIRTQRGDLSTNRDSEGCGSPSPNNSDAGAKPEQPVCGQVGFNRGHV